jgi:hypothetical protein
MWGGRKSIPVNARVLAATNETWSKKSETAISARTCIIG